jgi:hypothetical protein
VALLLLFLRRRFLAGAAALTALGLGLTEATLAANVHNTQSGYLLWLGSMALLAAGSFWAWLRMALAPSTAPEPTEPDGQAIPSDGGIPAAPP